MTSEDYLGADETAQFQDGLLEQLQTHLSPEEESAVGSLPSGSALLIVKSGPGLGSRFLLDADSTLAGRHPEADIFLDDVTVSRKHAEFVRSGTKFEVRDLGSMNGTYVSGKAIDSSSLSHGDEIQVGKYRLTFFAAEADR